MWFITRIVELYVVYVEVNKKNPGKSTITFSLVGLIGNKIMVGVF